MSELLERAVEKALEERRKHDVGVSALVDLVQKGLLGLLHGAQEVETARRDIEHQRQALHNELATLARERDPASRLDRTYTPAASDSEAERAIRERDMTIDLLERRLAKLASTLEQTERALQRASASQNLERGIESLYRVVQGLSESDPQVDQKRAMMRDIFRANLELRSQFERKRSGEADTAHAASEPQLADRRQPRL
jgi:predicted RNase H-like nuclease (RuvC/YqgF family)